MAQWLDVETLEADGHVLRVDPGDTLGLGRPAGYEPLESRVLESLVEAGTTVIDGGANVGWYTLRFARATGPRGRVFAFEPMPRTQRLLAHNLRVNGYRHVTLVPRALSGDSAPACLFLSTSNEGDHRVHDPDGTREAIAIDTITLDECLRDHDDPISLIKLDIQGAEAQALDGMRRTLARHPETWIATEFWPAGLRDAGSSAAAYLTELRAFGSAVLRLDERHTRLVPLDMNWLAESVTESRGNHTNLLIVPRAWRAARDWPLVVRELAAAAR